VGYQLRNDIEPGLRIDFGSRYADRAYSESGRGMDMENGFTGDEALLGWVV
jgi:hypothetical protein